MVSANYALSNLSLIDKHNVDPSILLERFTKSMDYPVPIVPTK